MSTAWVPVEVDVLMVAWPDVGEGLLVNVRPGSAAAAAKRPSDPLADLGNLCLRPRHSGLGAIDSRVCPTRGSTHARERSSILGLRPQLASEPRNTRWMSFHRYSLRVVSWTTSTRSKAVKRTAARDGRTCQRSRACTGSVS